jgi:Zn-dependent protease with chaperone function
MIDEIIRVTKGNIAVMILLGAVGIVATPVSIGSSWFAYSCQLTINEAKAEYLPPPTLSVHFRNIFFIMAIIFGPVGYFSTYFLYKMLTNMN